MLYERQNIKQNKTKRKLLPEVIMLFEPSLYFSIWLLGLSNPASWTMPKKTDFSFSINTSGLSNSKTRPSPRTKILIKNKKKTMYNILSN